MKFVMTTAVAASVLTLLATGLAEAEKKDCTNVRFECRVAVVGGRHGQYWRDRAPEGIYAKISACIRARGCVPQGTGPIYP